MSKIMSTLTQCMDAFGVMYNAAVDREDQRALLFGHGCVWRVTVKGYLLLVRNDD